MTGNAKAVAVATGFAAVLALGTYLLGRDGFAEDGVVVRSSLRTSPDGVAGLSRSLARLGRPTAQRMTPFADADPLRGTLVVLEPTNPPSPREAGALLDWVRAGGTLLYAPSFRRSAFRPRARRPEVAPLILDSLGLVLRHTAPETPRPGGAVAEEPGPAWTPHALTAGLPPALPGSYAIAGEAGEALDADDAPGADDAGEAGEAPDAGDAPGARDADNAGDADDAPEPLGRPAAAAGASAVPIDTLLAAPGDGVAAGLATLGEGRIVMFANAAPLSNEQSKDDPLAVLAVRAALAYTAPGDTVFFDEFHHGVYGLGSPASAVAGFLLGTPAGRALLQLALAGLAALAFAGMRLGAPRDPPRETRHSPLQHVSALARLYERSGARDTAALLLTARLARAAGLPAPRNRDEAGAALEALERRGRHKSAVERVRKGWRSSPPNLVAIAGGVDQYGRRRTS